MFEIDINIRFKYFLSTLCLLFSAIFIKVECHIGQPCNLLRICLPLSAHIYCDQIENICKCKKDFPIVVAEHTCLSPKRVSERCSHPEECHYLDKNSHCNQSPYSSRCECNSGFVFDKNQRICVTETKNMRKPSNAALMIPTAAGFLMACFSLLCCCALIWHNLCRKQDLINRNAQNLSSNRNRNRRNANDTTRGSGLNYNRNTSNESQTSTHLPPYESVLIDTMNNDPPPSYEDAIKDSQLPHVSTQTNAETKIT